MQLVAYVMPGMPHGMLSKMGVLASAQSRSAGGKLAHLTSGIVTACTVCLQLSESGCAFFTSIGLVLRGTQDQSVHKESVLLLRSCIFMLSRQDGNRL